MTLATATDGLISVEGTVNGERVAFVKKPPVEEPAFTGDISCIPEDAVRNAIALCFTTLSSKVIRSSYLIKRQLDLTTYQQ